MLLWSLLRSQWSDSFLTVLHLVSDYPLGTLLCLRPNLFIKDWVLVPVRLATLYKQGLTPGSFTSSLPPQPYWLWETDPCWWPTDTSLTTWSGAWVDSAGNREVSGRVEVAKQWASAIVCTAVNGAESDLCLAESTLQRQAGGKGLEMQRRKNHSFCFWGWTFSPGYFPWMAKESLKVDSHGQSVHPGWRDF